MAVIKEQQNSKKHLVGRVNEEGVSNSNYPSPSTQHLQRQTSVYVEDGDVGRLCSGYRRTNADTKRGMNR